jgi:hypothetical protein
MATTNVLSQTAINESTDTLATPYNLPCDSTLTLVAPSGGLVSSSLITFTLSSDSILSTTFSIGEVPRYRLKSNSTATKTDLIRVVNGTDEVIASHDRRVLGDVIVRPGGEKVKVTKWITTVSKREDAYVPQFPPDIYCSLTISFSEQRKWDLIESCLPWHLSPAKRHISGESTYKTRWLYVVPALLISSRI